ncbi:MAG: NTP transferase domain-containing protein [bacterium]|nr:NTP transferase domain-containing protein [bacterium]
MKYKVCILAAGASGQMGDLTKHVNRAILPVNQKAVISHIIEKFPENVEIVIAVGHEKKSVTDYVSIAHPERSVTFVEIDKYMGPGTGPGYSLLQCQSKLQQPFVVITADTLVLDEIPEPSYNWLGIAPIKETERYCTVKIKNNLVYELDDKVKNNNKFAFIGLAGVFDYRDFFEALSQNKEMLSGEIQLSNGFKKLIEKKLTPVGFAWFDTGSRESYEETNKNFSGGTSKFDFSKGNEFIYFVNSRVVKFFADEKMAHNRYLRATGTLKGLCPPIEIYKGNFYAYKKLDGQVLYDIVNPKNSADFFEWAEANLWKKSNLSGTKKSAFLAACKKFYFTKTAERIDAYHKKAGIADDTYIVNGVSLPPLHELFKLISWESLYEGTPSRFHGDLQFDNVLVRSDKTNSNNKFILIDWRQDFGGLLDVGDLYYDLAKLYGGMIISYREIKNGSFSFEMSGSNVYYNFSIDHNLLEAREAYEAFLDKQGYDLKKVKILTGLIFLNMSPLHNSPFDGLLYHLGKSMLYKAVTK